MTPSRKRRRRARRPRAVTVFKTRLGQASRRPWPLLLFPALVILTAACGGRRESERPTAEADTASSRSVPAETPGSADSSTADSTSNAGEPAGPCATDQLDPERLDLAADWEKGHVHVRGRVSGGTGRTLVLSLTSGGKFVFDEVFRDQRLASIDLASDSVDVRSATYAPTPAEQAAFDRRGAVALASASELCLDIALYDRLDLLASRHIPLGPPR